tara:strand:- start:1022 stop:3427 length:2406 start_codon:yes stop_codon:yes gene_type:complete
MSVQTVNTLIDANPDFGTLSQKIRLLKGGEVMSQSDYFHDDYAFNAVKLFDKSLETFWHCNVKGGKNYNLSDKENHAFKQDPYVRSSPYISVYQGGGTATTKYSTPITGGGSVAGSWAQITFPKQAFPGDMYIQIRKNNYNTNAQREMIKKVTFCCSDNDQDTPDSLKVWKHLATYDFGPRYATKIEFRFKGVYGFEYFNIEINGKVFSSYTAKKTESSETIYIGGLDSLKIVFVNKKSFRQTGGAIPPAIMFSRFSVNNKEMRDFIQHETRRENRRPVGGILKAAEGYDLVAAFPGDAEKPMFMPIKLDAGQFKYDARNSGTRTIRMIVEELYGGTKFNIANWNIMGTLGPVAVDTSNPGEPVSSFYKGSEGFTNALIQPRQQIDNSIFNGIFTNTPDITGMSLTNEPFKSIKPLKKIENKVVKSDSQINKGIKKRFNSKIKNRYVKEGFIGASEGTSGTETVPPDVISMEKEVIRLINKFNDEYALYIHCNGLHLDDSNRKIKSSENGEGKCWPQQDFYRIIQKIVIRFKVANNVNSGTNSWEFLTFLGTKFGETDGDGTVAEPFTQQFKDVFFSPPSANETGEYSITIENSYEDGTGELEQPEIGGALHGLHEFNGTINGVKFGFGSTKLELNELQITIFDQRGGNNTSSYDLINIKADGGSEAVLEQFQNVGSATGAPSNVSFDIPTNTLSFYNKGLDKLKSTYEELTNMLNEMTSASITNKKNLAEYTGDAETLSNAIKQFKDIRYNMDMKLRELYYLDGTNSANAKLTYGGTMLSGMLWTALTASVLYYTFYEMD